MSSASIKSSRRIVVSAIIGLGALTGASLAAAPAIAARTAAAPTVIAISIFSGLQKVTSTTGHKLTTSLTTTPGVSTSSRAIGLDVAVGTRTLGELHDWGFQIPSRALTLGNTGKGTLSVPRNRISPFGSVALKLAPSGPAHTTMCHGQPLTKTRPVTMSGKFLFNTHSKGAHKWGYVGSHRFRFPAGTVTWSYNNPFIAQCLAAATTCTVGITYNVQEHLVSLFGVKQGNVSTLTADRAVTFTKPPGASRTDRVTSKVKTTLKIAPNKHATLKVVGTGLATGSAVWKSSAAAIPYVQPCGKNDASSTHQLQWGGSYTNGKPWLAFHEVFGTLHSPNVQENAIFSRTTK